MNGDYIIDFVFSIHRSYPLDTISEISTDMIHAVEAVISAIDCINEDDSVLPNVTIGYVIHDDFNNQRQVTDITMKLSQRILSSSLMTNRYQLCSSKDNNCRNDYTDNSFSFKLSSSSKRNIKNRRASNGQKYKKSKTYNANKYADDEMNNQIFQKPVVAVVGSSTSDTTVSLATTLQLIGVPIVNCMATSNVFNRWFSFPNFLRVVPSDKFQVQAIFDIIIYFQWSYIFVLTTNNYYGLEGLLLMETEAADHNVCLNSLSIRAHRNGTIDEEAIQKALEILIKDDRVKVAIVFMLETDAMKFFTEVYRNNITGITWIASEAWAEREEFLLFPPHIMKGTIGITLNSQTYKYLKECPVRIHRQRNKWLLPFLCQQYNIANNCSWKYLQSLSDFPQNISSLHEFFPISSNYIWVFTFNAIYTIAKGLHDLLNDNMNGNKSHPTISYGELLKKFKQINFTGFSEVPTQLDLSGQVINAHYDIISVQFNESAQRLQYINIGSWQQVNGNASLQLKSSQIQWNEGTKPISRCSIPCGTGYKRRIGSRSCCWVCERCPPDSVSKGNSSLQCSTCQDLKHPNDDNSECVDDVWIWFKYDSPGGIIVILNCSAGELLCVALLVLLSKHRKHTLYINMSFKCLSCFLAVWGFILPLTFLLRHLEIICSVNITCVQLFYVLHFSLMLFSISTVQHNVRLLGRLVKSIRLKCSGKGDTSSELNHITFGMNNKWRFLNCLNTLNIIFFLTILLGMSSLTFKGLQIPAEVVKQKVSPANIFLYCRSNNLEFYFSLLYDIAMLFMILLFSNKSRNSSSNKDFFDSVSPTCKAYYDNDKIIYYHALLITLVYFTFKPFERFDNKPSISTTLQVTSVIIIQYIFVISTYGTKLYIIYREIIKLNKTKSK
ncbi:metabotropic glutamate receptor 8-like [Argonauta hians]